MWVPNSQQFWLPSLLLHSPLSGPLLHALCPPRCLERSCRRCPHLTSTPPCLSNQEVSNKRLGSPSRALAESSSPTEKLPPIASLSPGTVPAWASLSPQHTVVPAQLWVPLTALAWAPRSALAVRAPGCFPLQLCSCGCPALLFLFLLLLLLPPYPPSCSSPLSSAPRENPLLSRDVQPQQGTLPETRRCTGHKEQGCSRAGTAKPWERAALGAGLKLQPSFLQWPFPAPPKLTHCRVQISQPPRKDPQCQTQWFADGALLNRRKHWC